MNPNCTKYIKCVNSMYEYLLQNYKTISEPHLISYYLLNELIV